MPKEQKKLRHYKLVDKDGETIGTAPQGITITPFGANAQKVKKVQVSEQEFDTINDEPAQGKRRKEKT